MSDLIDRQALLKTLNENKIEFNSDVNYFIMHAPTIKTISVEEAIEEYNKRLCDSIAKAVFSIRSFSKEDLKQANELSNEFNSLLKKYEGGKP